MHLCMFLLEMEASHPVGFVHKKCHNVFLQKLNLNADKFDNYNYVKLKNIGYSWSGL